MELAQSEARLQNREQPEILTCFQRDEEIPEEFYDPLVHSMYFLRGPYRA